MSKIKSILAFVALMLCGGAWAATPVAVWEGDFKNTTKGSYTLTANGNKVADDGSTITIVSTASKGVVVSWTTGRGAATVIAKVSSVPDKGTSNKVLLSAGDGASDRVGVTLGTDGRASGIWDNGNWNTTVQTRGNISKDESGLTYYALAHAYNGGTYFYQNAGSGWSCAFGASGLGSPAYDGSKFKDVAIGGKASASTAYGNANDLVIEAIAVFDSKLSQDDIAGYKFPSEDATMIATISNGNVAQDIGALTWVDGEGNTVAYNKSAKLAIKGDGKVSTSAETIPTGSVVVEKGVELVYTTTSSAVHHGNGTITFSGVLPADNVGLGVWKGTVKVSNVNYSQNGEKKIQNWGNANSTVCLNGTAGYFTNYNSTTTKAFVGTIELEDYDQTTYAWKQNNGASQGIQTIGALTGTGTWYGESGKATQTTNVGNSPNFAGSLKLDNESTIRFGNEAYAANKRGYIFIERDYTAGLGGTWSSMHGIQINGTVVAKGGTFGSNVTFGNDATIDVSAGNEKAISIANAKTLTLGTGLNLKGAVNNSIILKNVATEPAGLSTFLLTVDGEPTVGRLVYKDGNIVFKATDETPYWKPNPAKIDANGIVNWTDTEAWLDYDGDPADWPEDGLINGVKINVQFDPETEVKGISITGPVSVGEVSVINTGANSNQFDFHNSTKDVDGEHEVTGGDTNDGLTATAVNLLTYDGRLGLKVPIVGPITFGANTKLIFKTGAQGEAASSAYGYSIGGRDGAIDVEGEGEFLIPTGMYANSFKPSATATVIVAGTEEMSGAISGSGKVKVTANATLSGEISCSGGIDLGANMLTLKVTEGERTLSATIIGSGSITKSGAGTLTVSSSNGNYTGSWTVAAGELKSTQKLAYGKDVNGVNSLTMTVNSGAKLYVDKMDDFTYNLVLAGGTVINGGGDINLNHRQIRTLTLSADSRVEGNSFGIVPGSHTGGTITLDGHTLNVAMNSGKKFGLDGMTDDETGGVIKVLSGKLGNDSVQNEASLSHTQIELAGGSLACDRRMTVKDVKVTTATTANTGTIKVIGNIEGKTFMMPNVTLGADALVKTVNDKGLNVTTALTLEGALRVSVYGATERNTYVAVTAPNATLSAATIKMIGQDGTEVPNACAKAIVENDLVVMRKLGGVSYVGMKTGALPSSFTPIAIFDETYTTDDIGTKLFVTSKSADGSFSTGKKNVPLLLASNESGDGVRALQFQILDGFLKCINVEVKAVQSTDGKTVIMAKKSGSGYVGNGTESTVEGQYGTKQTSLSSHGYDTTDFTVGNLDAANFTFDGNANTLSGWFTSWGGSEFADADKVVGPNGKAAYASKNDHRPWNSLNINNKEDYTISIYGSVDNVSVAAGKNGVIFAAGNCYSGDDVLALVKKPDGSVALTATGTNGGLIQSDVLDAGYHLFTIVKSQGRVYSLYVDGTQAGSTTRWKNFTHNGDIQLATLPGGTKDDYLSGDNAAYAMILGFDAALEADNIAELAKKYPYVDTSAVTEMTVSALNTAGAMFINSDATLTFDTDIANGCAVANLSGESVTLTLKTSGDKKFVSAADIKKLRLDANIKLDYGWTAHKVISVNYVWKSGTTILAKMAEGDSVETVDGTLGGLVKRSTWNDIVIDQNNNYVTDSADLTKMAVDGTTLETISGVTATRYSRGTYRTKNGNNPLTTDFPFVNGYLDDLNTGDAVSITVSGIPFRTYDVVVYFQTDGSAHPTLQIVQGTTTTNYRYNAAKELVPVSDTGTWGTGNYNGFSYDANVMRVTNLNGHTVKVTTNKASGERSSIAAIQIVQMSTDAEDEEIANAVAFIGNEPYATLAQAIADAEEDEVIIDLVKATDETVVIPSNVTVVPATTSCKMSGAITGEGTIKLSWPNQDANPNVWYTTYFGDATLNDFTGTLHFASGRFQSNTTIPSGIKLNITNGAQLWLTGGDAWANAMTISGYGWSGTSGIEAAKIRLNGGCEISGDIAVLVVDDIIPTLGNYSGVATYSGTITAASGVKTYAGMNGTITLTAANLADVTSIEVTEGTLALDATENTTLSSVISGSGKVVKTGTGALTLSGANTFSGGLTINAGVVKAGVGGVGSTSSAVGTGTVVVSSNGTFDVNGQEFDTNGNGYTIQSAGTLKNGGEVLYAIKRVIKRLELTGDTTISDGERFGMGVYQNGNTTEYPTYIVMGGNTLNIDTSTFFNLQNTEITGGGEIVVRQGTLLGYGKTCSYDGKLKTTGTGKLELNNEYALTFTVRDFELGSNQGVGSSGNLKVTGTLSTAANYNYQVPNLIMGDGATIKLANAQRVSATTKFEIGDRLNIDCSAVTDTSFDAIEVPATFHNDDNWDTNQAKLKSWIGPDYKVGAYTFAQGNWLRILFGTEPQTKSTEVVTTEGGTTIENVVLPMAITETGKTNETAANGEMKVWEAYVLGLDYASETAKPIISSAQTAEAGSIKLVDNLTPKTDVGVNVTRKLFVGTAPGSMSEVQEASYDNGFTVDVPTGDDKVKYLKIKYTFE